MSQDPLLACDSGTATYNPTIFLFAKLPFEFKLRLSNRDLKIGNDKNENRKDLGKTKSYSGDRYVITVFFHLTRTHTRWSSERLYSLL